YTEKTNFVTLFHKEAEPRGIMRYMVRRWGITDAQGRKSFRHTISGKSEKFVVVDGAATVIVRPLKGNGPVPMWTHDTLLNAATKLRRLLLIKGERNGKKVRYIQADCYEDLHLTLLISEMIQGAIAIDFDARESKPGADGLRNHGTKFRVKPENVCRLYFKKERFT
ncbi:MAG: MvaI/BcnI family restriction endonuclease, partial [Pyrinomonadaceae bacterium]